MAREVGAVSDQFSCYAAAAALLVAVALTGGACTPRAAAHADAVDAQKAGTHETAGQSPEMATSADVLCAPGTLPGTPCDDLNPCTTKDSCGLGNVCAGAPCVVASKCTNSTCTAAGCVTTPHTCSDGNACTEDSCHDLFGCKHTKIVGCPSCADPGSAGYPCEVVPGACLKGVCDGRGGCGVPLPAGTTCKGKTSCQTKCNADGACTDGKPGNGCGESYVYDPCMSPPDCTEDGECVSEPLVGKYCSSQADSCLQGSCNESGVCVAVIQTGKQCNFGVGACQTTGICDADAICQGPKTSKSCFSGTPNPCLAATCNGAGICSGLVPLVGTPCTTVPVCHAGACDSKGVCLATPLAAGAACIPDDVCLGPGVCDGKGKCTGQLVVGKSCGDTGNPCMEQRCGKAGGCEAVTLVGKVCSDSGDVCRPGLCNAAGQCAGGFAPGKTCATEGLCQQPFGTCDGTGACVAKPAVGQPCASGPCIDKGTCDAKGACVGAAKVGAPCPAKACEVAGSGVCQANATCAGTAKPDGTPCDPIGGCVSGSKCQGGKCVLGAANAACGQGEICLQALCCAGAALADPICADWAGRCRYVPMMNTPCYYKVSQYDTNHCRAGLCSAAGGVGTCNMWTQNWCKGLGVGCKTQTCDEGKCNPNLDPCPVNLVCTKNVCTTNGCSSAAANEGVTCAPGRVCSQGQCALP